MRINNPRMDRFDALRLFTRIVARGSFSRAAAELEIPRATATLAIKQLEARLGTRLLERTTRQVRATAEGQAFAERCHHLLRELDDAESLLQQRADHLQGILRVDVHGSHASHVILPRLGEFHSRHPQLQLVLGSGDRQVDLLREGVDCVVRSGWPRDSSLVARRLAVLPEVVCASPGYLGRHGIPQQPDDLRSGHQAVRFFTPDYDSDYPFEFIIDGQRREFVLPGWIAVNEAGAYLAAAVHGHGLIQLPRLSAEAHLQTGQLVEVLAGWPSPGLPVSVMYPQHRQSSPRLRVFIDWLLEIYAQRFGAPAGVATTVATEKNVPLPAAFP